MSDHPAKVPAQNPEPAPESAKAPQILRRTFKFGVGLASLLFVAFSTVWLKPSLCGLCQEGLGESLLLATGALSFSVALLGSGYLLVGDDDKSGLAHSWRESGDRRK